eukprot:103754-Chlamydomonas_euryale.AAC.1
MCIRDRPCAEHGNERQGADNTREKGEEGVRMMPYRWQKPAACMNVTASSSCTKKKHAMDSGSRPWFSLSRSRRSGPATSSHCTRGRTGCGGVTNMPEKV